MFYPTSVFGAAGAGAGRKRKGRKAGQAGQKPQGHLYPAEGTFFSRLDRWESCHAGLCVRCHVCRLQNSIRVSEVCRGPLSSCAGTDARRVEDARAGLCTRPGTRDRLSPPAAETVPIGHVLPQHQPSASFLIPPVTFPQPRHVFRQLNTTRNSRCPHHKRPESKFLGAECKKRGLQGGTSSGAEASARSCLLMASRGARPSPSPLCLG